MKIVFGKTMRRKVRDQMWDQIWYPWNRTSNPEVRDSICKLWKPVSTNQMLNFFYDDKKNKIWKTDISAN